MNRFVCVTKKAWNLKQVRYVLYADISVCGVCIYIASWNGVLLEEVTGFHLAKK